MGNLPINWSDLKNWPLARAKMAALLWVFGLALLHAQGIDRGMVQGVAKNEDFRIRESKEFVVFFMDFLLDPSEEHSFSLADALLKDSKPIPALAIVNYARKTFPDSNRLFGPLNSQLSMKGLEVEIQENLSHLRQQLQYYRAETRTPGALSAYISLASIKYNLGMIREAAHLLDVAMQKKGRQHQLFAMKQAFFLENQNTSIAYLKVEGLLRQSLQKLDFDASIQLCAQLCYLGIYAEDPIEVLGDFQKTFSEQVAPEAVRILIAMPDTIKGFTF